MVKRARDISIEDYRKLVIAFDNVVMCGQIGDPIYHPKFTELLEESWTLNSLVVNTNGSGKKYSWWDNVFELSRVFGNVTWRFSLDGLPHQSHQYRINQDGEQVWKVMKRAKYWDVPIIWQYIPFRYNEDSVEQARQMAADHGIEFMLKKSNRHPEGMKPLNPDMRIDYVELPD